MQSKKRKTLERTSCSAVVRAGSVVIPDELLRNKFERTRKMAGLSVTENIDSIENCELKNLLLHLFTKLSAKDEKKLAFESRVVYPEKRADEWEKYSSKGCLIFQNLQIQKPEGNVPTPTLERKVLCLFSQYLNWENYPHNFKVCHPLGSW